MKYSYLWLKELSGTKKSPNQLAELLTMRSFEFEGAKNEGKETQMEFSVLPNRGHDALSHIGLAREICALEGQKYQEKGNRKVNLKPGLKVEIEDKNLCPRYIGAILKNIFVSQSPKWIQDKLLVCGVKPINNVVDATNYVMLETGQPMHAFDADKATGNIIVRKAKKGEKIKLLDENEYELSENNLVIADSNKVLALAGVMGGFDSSISKNTTSIILESANFNSTSIRKTRTSLNIITESSHRFERDIDPNFAEMAMARAIELLKKNGGKNVEVSTLSDIYSKKVKSWQVKLNTDYANSLLGENIPVLKMKHILENFGIKIKSGKNMLDCEIPTRRIDLKTQEDLIEEIGRIYGYDNIKEQALAAEVKNPPQNAKRDFEKYLQDILAGLGFSEVMNYSFYGKSDIENFELNIRDHIEVSNPLSLDQQYLRSELILGVVKNVALNMKYFDGCSIFEIGNVFSAKNMKEKEITRLAGAFAENNTKNTLFYELKGKIEELFKRIEIESVEFEQPKVVGSFMHPTRTAVIKAGNKVIGCIGELNPYVLRKYGLKERPVFFELTIQGLEENSRLAEKKYHSIVKFPLVERDLSMFIGKDTKYSDIWGSIIKAGGGFVKNIDLFDVFEKEGEKSLALRIKIGSDAKTLASEEIDSMMKKIISALEKDLKVRVRK
jgi:phenylalanyl-tRNA synthetase beta chain